MLLNAWPLLTLASSLLAQEPQPPELQTDIVVTATRGEADPIQVPRAISWVGEDELSRSLAAVAVDALRLLPGVWVEHRTATSGDVVLRGLSGGNLLALVDGNTLSTFWGEGGFAGDDMYGKVDPWSLEQIEVVRGPASVLYGSNALGGVINFITRKPPLDFTAEGTAWGGETRAAYSTNNDAMRVRTDLWGANPTMRWRLGGSLGHYDDYENGAGRVLSATGGQEGNLDWNSEFLLSEHEWLVLDVQDVHRDPVYRHYRPTQSNSNDRTGVNVELHTERGGAAWDEAFVRLYHQDKLDRRFFDTGDVGVARWETWAGDAQASKQIGAHALTYGLAYHLDVGESPDDEQFTIWPAGGGAPSKPAPDSDWSNWGFYLQDDWDFAADWSLLGSARWDTFSFESHSDIHYTPPAGSPRALGNTSSDESALTGGLALTRHLGEAANVYASWFRGFRQFAPNFGLRELGYGVLAPNDLLDPVEGDTFELGWKHGAETLTAEAVLYRTDFTNFQNIVAGSYQGSNYYDYDKSGTLDADERVYQVAGNGEGYVHGVECGARARLDRWLPGDAAGDWWLGGSLMWNRGQDETNGVPLRHTHPLRGVLSALWEPRDSRNGLYFGVDVEMVDRYTRIDPARLTSDVGYLNDPQDPASGLIRSWGLPGYTLVTLRGGYEFANGVELYAVLDNATDALYRGAHSRADGMGINLSVGVTVPL